MKVYLVIADNEQDYDLHRRWNVGIFASEKAAQKRVNEIFNEVNAAENRIDELEELLYTTGERSAEETEEYERLMKISCRYWHFFDRGRFIIEEYEVFE